VTVVLGPSSSQVEGESCCAFVRAYGYVSQAVHVPCFRASMLLLGALVLVLALGMSLVLGAGFSPALRLADGLERDDHPCAMDGRREM
jgi:hypothetical protein